MKRVRVALFGAGAWGLNHLRVLLAEPRCEVTAVADPDNAARERARSLAPSAALFKSAAEALQEPDLDAVILATPASTHAEMTCAALAVGKHVLVEKPLATSIADARRVAKLAATNGRVVMCGHLMVFHPAVVRVRELVESEVLGRVRYIHSTRANLGRARKDESVLWCYGPHDLSILDYVLGGSPESVGAVGQCITHPGIEDVVFMTLRYADGTIANIHLSRVHPRKERRVTIVCAQKLVEFDDVASEKLRIHDKAYDQLPDFKQFAEYLSIRDGDVYIPRLALDEPLRLQLLHFLSSIEHRTPPRTDVASALRVTSALAAAQRSLELGGVPVKLATYRA